MDGRVTTLRESIKSKNEEVTRYFETLGDEEPKAEDVKRIKDLNKTIEEEEHKLADLLEVAGMKTAATKRSEDFKTPAGSLPYPGAQPEFSGDRAALQQGTKTAGELWCENPEVKAFLERHKNSPNSRAPFGQSPAQTLNLPLKTLITGAGSTLAGAFIVNDRRPIVDPGTFRQELRIQDLITTLTTTSDTIEYVREGSHTNAAATVAEATATTGTSGEKPESAMVFSVVTETIKTIAHWIPATRRALSDAPQIRGIIDSFLRYGLQEELEAQIISGGGTGEDFTGVLNTSGTTAQAWDTDILTTTRKARTKVRLTGRATPTAYVMHPNDWQTIDLLQDAELRYFFGGPTVMGTPRLWGLPVVEVEGMTEGTAVVADWRLAVLWDREQTNILVSDSHDNFFIRNLIAILAELRAGFGILRPAAFVEIDLTA